MDNLPNLQEKMHLTWLYKYGIPLVVSKRPYIQVLLFGKLWVDTFNYQWSKFIPFIASVIDFENEPFSQSIISQHDYHVHHSLGG